MTRLRPLRRRDIERVAAWLPDVARDAGCDRWASVEAIERAVGDTRVLVPRDGDAFVAYEADSPKRKAATVRLIAVPPEARRLGTGGRVALALEEWLGRSVERIYAIVPARLGLALYFWLRHGYRPLIQPDWPAEPVERPAVWMARDLR